MRIKKKTLHIEQYNIENQKEFFNTMRENSYFTDLEGYTFEAFPTSTVFLMHGDLWFVKRKSIIFSFCVVIDFSNLPILLRQMYSEAGNIDYKDIAKYNDIFIQELGVSPRFRRAGLGSKMFEFVKSKYKNRAILLKADDTAVGFWEKMNFSMIDGTQLNNMILENS